MSGYRVTVVPLTLPRANECVAMWHRHHAPISPGLVWYCLGAVVDGVICGAAICGQPSNRNNDDRFTVEVIRLASDGTANVCSALYGAAKRVAREMGSARIITYTLESETGSSLRGAGWNREADGIKSKWLKGTSRRLAIPRPHMHESKVRWAVHFRPAAEYTFPDRKDGLLQELLF